MKNSNPEKVPFYKKKWFAAIVVLILIGAIFGPKDKDKKETPEPAKVEEKQEEKQEEKKDDNEITADMSEDEKIEKILKKVGGDQYKSHEIKKDNKGAISQITLDTYIDPNTVWDGKAAVKQQETKVVNALKALKENKINYNYFVLQATSTFTDKYGNDSENELMHIYLKQSEADKINFEKFQEENLKTIADEYYVHPSVK